MFLSSHYGDNVYKRTELAFIVIVENEFVAICVFTFITAIKFQSFMCQILQSKVFIVVMRYILFYYKK